MHYRHRRRSGWLRRRAGSLPRARRLSRPHRIVCRLERSRTYPPARRPTPPLRPTWGSVFQTVPFEAPSARLFPKAVLDKTSAAKVEGTIFVWRLVFINRSIPFAGLKNLVPQRTSFEIVAGRLGAKGSKRKQKEIGRT